MSIVANSIAGNAFIDLAGFPIAESPQLTPYVRAGVDGVTVVDEGSRGTEFVIRSRGDQADIASAWDAYRGYLDLKGGDPVNIVFQDVPLVDSGIQFVVLDVTPVKVHALGVAVGGVNPPSHAWLECDWKLIAVGSS